MSGSHEREHAAIGAKISNLPAMQAFCKFLADVLLFALVSEAGCGPGFKCLHSFGYVNALLSVAALWVSALQGSLQILWPGFKMELFLCCGLW
ncbi:hypothetical protein U1Q18_003513 [Sarracenia purpurea var. burkii]